MLTEQQIKDYIMHMEIIRDAPCNHGDNLMEHLQCIAQRAHIESVIERFKQILEPPEGLLQAMKNCEERALEIKKEEQARKQVKARKKAKKEKNKRGDINTKVWGAEPSSN